MQKTNKNGFSLIELVIVIIILGILAVVAIPNYVDLKNKAKLNALKSALGTMRAAISLKYSENLISSITPTYPTNIIGSMFETGTVPKDPYADTNTVTTSNANPLVPAGNGGWLYNPETGEIRNNNSLYAEW